MNGTVCATDASDFLCLASTTPAWSYQNSIVHWNQHETDPKQSTPSTLEQLSFWISIDADADGSAN
jgi:hypothetical protein